MAHVWPDAKLMGELEFDRPLQWTDSSSTLNCCGKMRVAAALPVAVLALRKQHSFTAVLKGRRATALLATLGKHSPPSCSSSTTNNNSRLRQRRLRPLLDLAVQYGAGGSVVDVGTDHGLLALALAQQQHASFTHVTGVDRSLAALEQGAFPLLLEQKQQSVPNRLSFQQGDGLQGFGNKGDADTVCIAGMGVHSMLRILRAATANVQRLVLQPTNSRPKNLMLLYESLLLSSDADSGGGRWVVQEERIDYLASRWYWTTLFVRKQDATPLLQQQQPGCCLVSHDGGGDDTFDAWVQHHCQWIQQTRELDDSPTTKNERERRWWVQFCENCSGKEKQ